MIWLSSCSQATKTRTKSYFFGQSNRIKIFTVNRQYIILYIKLTVQNSFIMVIISTGNEFCYIQKKQPTKVEQTQYICSTHRQYVYVPYHRGSFRASSRSRCLAASCWMAAAWANSYIQEHPTISITAVYLKFPNPLQWNQLSN